MSPPAVKPPAGLSGFPLASSSLTELLLKLFTQTLLAVSVVIPHGWLVEYQMW